MSKKAFEIMKMNYSAAAKAAGAQNVNRKLVNTAKDLLAQQGINTEMLNTPLGQDIAQLVMPSLLLLAATNPAVVKMLPAGIADKIAMVATYAHQGASYETADRLIQSVLPVLQEFAGMLDDVETDSVSAG